MNQSKQAIISLKGIDKSFDIGTQQVRVLKNVSFDIPTGEFLVIFGASGSGKSTLLHTLLGLEQPTKGTVVFAKTDLYQKGMTDDMRSDFRKHNIGMVYQQANWIKSLTVEENVAFPLLLLGMSKEAALQKAREMLKMVEMDGWAGYQPTELSGGQQQRVSLSRAIITNPQVIIADEPTGNLDFESGEDIMQLLQNLNLQQHKTIIMVTHDLEYLRFATSAVKMFDGTVSEVYEDLTDEKLVAQLRAKRVPSAVMPTSTAQTKGAT
ncbi:ABC transporter ATP-binding protein [Candidatus Woesebacteria bacterium]|nr:ABC transporter ATP-binding protein [Candidatus Woesebacteria bacterium]